MNIFSNINNIAPGIPSIPVTSAVIAFNPIWNWNKFPIKFTIKINNPPNNEFPIIFNINLIGNKKNFPIINKNNIQPKYTIIVFVSKIITFPFIINFYD